MIRICWLIACFFTLTVSAQRKLVIMGKSPDNYIVYVTSGKESLKDVSNHFGLSVAKLSACIEPVCFNETDGISLFKKIKASGFMQKCFNNL